jgi:hypothetical protein
MPVFHIPKAESAKQAELVYSQLCKQNPYPHKPGRLFRITFVHRKNLMIAEVGKTIQGWREPDGVVLAIIEGTELVTVHTLARGGLSDVAIHVSPDEVRERVYFDDFPARF